MDYMGIFRPIFVYALHLAQANPNQNHWLADERAVQHDLSSLLAAARSGGAGQNDPYLDDAWFAVYTWLEEILGHLENGDLIARELLPESDPGGSEFYRRLNRLLTPGEDGVINRDAIKAIHIYNLCLEYDYRGYYARPGCEHQRQAYRRRCRQTLESVLLPSDLASEADEPPKKFRWCCSRVAMWILPIAATILLYGMYRTLLKNLYQSVVG